MNKKYYLFLILLVIVSFALITILVLRAYQTDLYFEQKSSETSQQSFKIT